jgi:hypothetical protein
VYKFGTNPGISGSGDYLFTLPNGLSFNTSLPLQEVYQGNLQANAWALAHYSVPASGMITNHTVGGQVYPVVWDATRFRIVTTTYGDSIRCWGSSYYQMSGTTGGIKLRFSFTST